MRRFFQITVLVLSVVTAVDVVPQAVAGKISVVAPEKHGVARFEQAFSITQKHYYLGRWKILLNKDKVKATNLTDGFSIVTMAPTWKVVYFRESGGAKMCETTMESFMLTGLPMSGGYVVEGNIRDAAQQKTDYRGLKTLQYRLKRTERNESKPAWTLADMPKEAAVGLSQYWVSPIITSDHMVGNFLQKLFMLPATVGYPVAFIDTRIDQSRNTVLDILSCEGLPRSAVQIAYPSPAKYKVCKGVREITLSTARRDSVNDWAETIGKD